MKTLLLATMVVLVLSIRVSDLDVVFSATLTVDCLLGIPPAGAAEGITVTVPGLISFDTIVSGATLYVLTAS